MRGGVACSVADQARPRQHRRTRRAQCGRDFKAEESPVVLAQACAWCGRNLKAQARRGHKAMRGGVRASPVLAQACAWCRRNFKAQARRGRDSTGAARGGRGADARRGPCTAARAPHERVYCHERACTKPAPCASALTKARRRRPPTPARADTRRSQGAAPFAAALTWRLHEAVQAQYSALSADASALSPPCTRRDA
jgi:hypothetical protein